MQILLEEHKKLLKTAKTKEAIVLITASTKRYTWRRAQTTKYVVSNLRNKIKQAKLDSVILRD